MTSKGLLVIFSGPSGTGKGTVMKSLLKQDRDVRLSVSATTRSPRPGETDGKDYYFLSREKFLAMKDAGEMLETAEYCGNFYGTPAAPIEKWISEGHDVFLEIEVQGGAQIKKKRPDAVALFVLPPSFEELERRLRGRGTEGNATVCCRMEAARREIAAAEHYDYIVVNDLVENAVRQIYSILRAEKSRSCRNTQFVERILKHD